MTAMTWTKRCMENSKRSANGNAVYVTRVTKMPKLSLLVCVKEVPAGFIKPAYKSVFDLSEILLRALMSI
jgi:hypothetical protein